MGYRRRRLDATDLLPQLAGMAVILCFVSPQVRAALRLSALAAIVVAVGAGVLFLGFTFWKRRSAPSLDAVSDLHAHTAAATMPVPPVSMPVSQRLNRIDWFQFEKLVAALFERQGYQVLRRGGARPDGGIDLEFRLDGIPIAVQCKKWNVWKVGVRQLREFLGAMTAGGYSQGMFVAAADITGEARDFARHHGIEIVDKRRLITLLEERISAGSDGIEAILHDSQKYCPKCERVMVVRVARRGRCAGKQFWACPGFPGCTYTAPMSSA